MSEKKTETLPEGQISLEDTFAEIEAIIAKMEQPDVTLDESFSLYKNGVAETVQRAARCSGEEDAGDRTGRDTGRFLKKER